MHTRRRGNGGFAMSVTPNRTDRVRVGTVTVSAPGAPTKTITVRQARATLSVTPSAVWNPNPLGGGSRTFTVRTTSDAVWNVSRGDANWLRVTQPGSRYRRGGGTFSITAQPNTGRGERTGTITISVEGAPTQRITVRQRPGPTIAQERASCSTMSARAIALLDDPAFNQARWNNATPRERENILHELFMEVNAILGQTPQRNLRFRDIGNTSGTFNRASGQVTINEHYLQDLDERDLQDFDLDDPPDEIIRRVMIARREDAMLTVIHEARHEFQYNATRDHSRFVVSLETRIMWQHNFDNYIEFGVGSIGAHYAQPIEWDAWNFMGRGYRIRFTIESEGLRPIYDGSWPW